MTLTFRKKPAESGIGEPREQPSMIARAPAAFGSLLAAAAILVAIASSERPAAGTAANETAASRSIPTSRHATALPKADMSATTTRAEPTAPSPEPIAPSSTKDLATGICRQTWTYDSEGNVLTQIDRRGLTTVNTYDRENRLRTQAKAGLLLQTRDYDADGNLRQHTDALGRLSAFTVDKANRKIREDRAGLATEQWTYTPLGDVATHTDADRRTTTNTYTSRRFLASESLAGETSQYTYDGAGHRLTHERPNGPASTWIYAYDGAGNLASVTDPDDHATAFGYDANNNRTRITDANAHVTTFTYDERNRLAGKTYPGGDAWHWRYDGDNNRIRSEAPNGRVTDIAFDALNRPTRSTYVGAPVGEVQSTAFAYDGNGNVRTITEVSSSGSRVETRDYDDFDRLVHAVDGDGRSQHYAYDDVGNRTRLTDPDGHDTVWTYNALNQNTRVAVPGLGTTTLGYTPSGRLTEISRPDGSISEHTYSDNGRLQSIRHTKAGATLARYDYVYDPDGNRTEQRELNGATTGETTQSTRYVYDDADRLVEVKEPSRTTTYTLDPVGNRIHESVVDGNTTAISQSTLTYNDRDQLTSRSDPVANVQVTQTWDANGNLATQTVNGQSPRVYAYDARDRLVGLTLPTSPTGPATLAFAYHADGLRREKTDGATTTRYHYDGQSLLAETNTLGNTLRQFHYSATQLIAQTQAGTTPTYRHVLLDALRSPIALLDPTGIITARTSYDAFGEIRAQLGTTGNLVTPNRDAANAELASTDQQPVGFTGYLKDSESGLYYAKARYYDPATARFTTEDPEAGKDLEPPSLHRYLYAYANPTAYTDRSGRCGNPSMADDSYCRWMQYEQDSLLIGANPDTTEGMRATFDYQIGKSEGNLRGTWDTIKSAAQFLADIPGTVADLAPGVDFGSMTRMRARATDTMEFVTSPVKLTTAAINDYENAFSGAVANQNFHAAGHIQGRVEGAIITGAVLSYLTPDKLPKLSNFRRLLNGRKAATAFEDTSGAAALRLGQGAIDRPVVPPPAESTVSAALPHPGLAAAESATVSRESIMRSLRQSESIEGAATAKLIKRGTVDLQLVPTDPWKQGAAGRAPFGSNQALLALDQIPNAQAAAGYAARETRHVLQKLNPETYRRIHELEAYQWQRAVDPSFGLSDEQILSWLSREPLYKDVPPSMVIRDVAK